MLYDSNDSLSFKEYLNTKPILVWIIVVLLVCLGFGVGIFGLYELFSTNDQEIVSSNDIENQVCDQSADFGQITVYVSGAVVEPGVYILNTGDRVTDAIQAGSGLSSEADTVYLNKNINYAKLITDGEQLYIPTKDEVIQSYENVEQVSFEQKEVYNDTSPISINSSTKSDLMELSGIGEVRAEKIIVNRPHNSIENLVEMKIISQSLFDEIKDKISL